MPRLLPPLETFRFFEAAARHLNFTHAAEEMHVTHGAVSQRIKRLEELMTRLNARKGEIEARLGDPAVYQDAEAVKALLQDRAYVARETEQVEAEWLEKHAMLDAEEGS